MDIGVYKRVLNSGELKCYEFLVGLREVNSWVELGELLIDVFNMMLDVSSGEVYMNSVSYDDFVKVYTTMLIKYLSYDSSVVYGFILPYNKTFKMHIMSGFKSDECIIEFKERPDDLIGLGNRHTILSGSSDINNCRIMDIDRGLGILDIGISNNYNPTIISERMIIKYVDVDLDILRLRSFTYLGKEYVNGMTISRNKTWVAYRVGYSYNEKQKSKGSDFSLKVISKGGDLPF